MSISTSCAPTRRRSIVVRLNGILAAGTAYAATVLIRRLSSWTADAYPVARDFTRRRYAGSRSTIQPGPSRHRCLLPSRAVGASAQLIDEAVTRGGCSRNL